MNTIKNIYINWRKGRGTSRISVGVLSKDTTGSVHFQYLKDGVEKAKNCGFSCYDGFRDLDTIYTESVLEIFGQRIVNTERNDLDDFFDFWKINRAYKSDIYYMLAYTQGLLPTDNFEFLADFEAIPGLTFVSEISGLTKLKLPPTTLTVGDILTYKLDNNKYDSSAVELYKGTKLIGYVKSVHCNVFSKTDTPFDVRVHHIEKNGVLNRVFIVISLK